MTSTDANKTESIYINDIATSSGNGTWPFTESHKWTTDGVHKSPGEGYILLYIPDSTSGGGRG